MKIYTSYYAKLARNPLGLVPVRISTSSPNWFPYICENLECVYPGWDLVNPVKQGTMSFEEYTEKYMAKLEALGKDELMRRLEEISARNGNRDLVLVCWESPEKVCHRHLIAKFLGLYDIELV